MRVTNLMGRCAFDIKPVTLGNNAAAQKLLSYHHPCLSMSESLVEQNDLRRRVFGLGGFTWQFFSSSGR
jgi:hypothetical protein